jgi:hypothetical protein
MPDTPERVDPKGLGRDRLDVGVVLAPDLDQALDLCLVVGVPERDLRRRLEARCTTKDSDASGGAEELRKVVDRGRIADV